MSKLISGKEALIAIANGESIEMTDSEVDMPWTEVRVESTNSQGKVEPCIWMFLNTPEHVKFRLKPRNITINGIEVPAPFEPKMGDIIYMISDDHDCGYFGITFESYVRITIGVWRTEDEIKQVVEALRSIFK